MLDLADIYNSDFFQYEEGHDMVVYLAVVGFILNGFGFYGMTRLPKGLMNQSIFLMTLANVFNSLGHVVKVFPNNQHNFVFKIIFFVHSEVMNLGCCALCAHMFTERILHFEIVGYIQKVRSRTFDITYVLYFLASMPFLGIVLCDRTCETDFMVMVYQYIKVAVFVVIPLAYLFCVAWPLLNCRISLTEEEQEERKDDLEIIGLMKLMVVIFVMGSLPLIIVNEIFLPMSIIDSTIKDLDGFRNFYNFCQCLYFIFYPLLLFCYPGLKVFGCKSKKRDKLDNAVLSILEEGGLFPDIVV